MSSAYYYDVYAFELCMLTTVIDLAPDLVKPYKVNEQVVNQAFELKHGASTKIFNMDKVSNGPFTDVS